MFGFSQPNVPQIDTSKVKDAIDSHKDIVLLDVRTEGEYSKNHIQGSINIPVNHISVRFEKEVVNKKKTIYVYCLSGSRSSQAVKEMIEPGYKDVFSMASGLLAWRAKKYPLT